MASQHCTANQRVVSTRVVELPARDGTTGAARTCPWFAAPSPYMDTDTFMGLQEQEPQDEDQAAGGSEAARQGRLQ